ncbi:MAG: hypothetical protein AAGA30_04655 [Planctomycetota bacterium]
MDQTWTTFRINSQYLRLWLYITSGVCAVLATVFTLIDKRSGLLLWCVLPNLVAILYTILARNRFRYNDETIQLRCFKNNTRNWSDAVAWSYHSVNSQISIYIRFTDGVVLGLNPLLLGRPEMFELIAHLMKHIGEPLRGDQIVLPPTPWLFNVFHR